MFKKCVDPSGASPPTVVLFNDIEQPNVVKRSTVGAALAAARVPGQIKSFY